MSSLLACFSGPLSSRRLFGWLVYVFIQFCPEERKIPEPFMIPGTELIIEIRRRTTCGPERDRERPLARLACNYVWCGQGGREGGSARARNTPSSADCTRSLAVYKSCSTGVFKERQFLHPYLGDKSNQLCGGGVGGGVGWLLLYTVCFYESNERHCDTQGISIFAFT